MFVLGGPGSGKGTQCERIVSELGFTHFSAGDLLRAEVDSGSDQGQKIQDTMEQGLLVPQELTIPLLKKAMESSPDAKGFLIDGFPREISQGKMFEDLIYPCALLLMFECSEEIMIERLLKRGQTSGRVDDNEESIRKRLATFNESTLPVVDHYESLNKVAKINSERSVDDVYADVVKKLIDLL